MDNPIRLLICTTCNTVEELPAYSGDPRGDTWLREKEKAHLLPSGSGFHGEYHIARIEQSDWLSHKEDIIRQMVSEFSTFSAAGEGSGLGQRFYDAKDNYSVDALKCWRVDHARTQNCSDYMTQKMRILPDTRAERKSEGLSANRPEIHLCQFCPYHQIVEQRRASEEYGYNYTT